MSRGQIIIEDIVNYFKAIRNEYKDVTNDMLLNDGDIFYMNGDDGTDFDWEMNGRCCEFFMFYKDSENGFIKVIVTGEDIIYGYHYDNNGKARGERFEEMSLDSGDAEYLYRLLLQEADDKGIYDEPISNIDFDAYVEDDGKKKKKKKDDYRSYRDDYDDYNENDDLDNYDDFGASNGYDDGWNDDDY